MTIELGDGLQFNEILEIAKALNVTRLVDPALRAELLSGANALLTILNGLKGVPFVLQLLPGNLGGQIDGAIKTVELAKALLEA